jgi:hypothetical protein
MISSLSSVLYRLSNRYTVVLSILIYGGFLSQVMAPQAAFMLEFTGSWGSPDGHFFYTPDVLYENLALWKDEGKQHYINFRLGLDPFWALTYGAFLVTIISVALRAAGGSHKSSLLNLVPLAPVLADIGENFLGIALVSALPERLDWLAWLTTCITSFKWITLVIAHLIMVYALAVAAQAAWARRH